MSALLALANPRRIKASHRRRRRCTTGHRQYANNNPYKFTDPDGRLVFLLPLIPPVLAAAADAVVFVGSAALVAYAGSEAINALNESAEGQTGGQPADTPASAGEKVRDGTSAGAGVSGKKGEREGAGGQTGADGAFDSVDGTNERSPRDGVRVKDLDGGGTIETHPSTKSADYPQGTPTVKVQDSGGKVTTTVRYPKDENP